MNENQPYRHIALNQAEVRELFDAFIVDSREQTRLLREGKRVCNQSPTFDTTAFNIWWARRGQAYVTGSRFEAEYCPKTKTGSLRMLVPVEYPMPQNDEARDDALLALLAERDANEWYR